MLRREKGPYCWSSSARLASSPALDASARCSPVSVSFSGGDLCFPGCLDGAEELRAIALRMVGYMKGLIRAFSAAAARRRRTAEASAPTPIEELLL